MQEMNEKKQNASTVYPECRNQLFKSIFILKPMKK
jgi:hypothetical protein